MGQITSALARPFRNYNIESRAIKVLEKRQKVAKAAPHYPTTVEKLSRFRDEHPEFLEAQKTRDEKLHEHLKHVHVESTHTLKPLTSSKPFPLNQKPLPDTDMGALEAQAEVPGRASLKTILSFLEQHRSNPKDFTASRIAKDQGLVEKEVEDILHYFKIFHLYIPKAMYESNKNMAKLVAEQMKSAPAFSSFVLPKKTEEKDKSESDLTQNKI